MRTAADHYSTLSAHVRLAVRHVEALGLDLARRELPDTTPLYDALRVSIRELGLLGNAGERRTDPGGRAWWTCPDCSCKLGAVSGATLTVIRADLQLDVRLHADSAVEAVCPKCRNRQVFVPT